MQIGTYNYTAEGEVITGEEQLAPTSSRDGKPTRRASIRMAHNAYLRGCCNHRYLASKCSIRRLYSL